MVKSLSQGELVGTGLDSHPWSQTSLSLLLYDFLSYLRLPLMYVFSSSLVNFLLQPPGGNFFNSSPPSTPPPCPRPLISVKDTPLPASHKPGGLPSPATTPTASSSTPCEVSLPSTSQPLSASPPLGPVISSPCLAFLVLLFFDLFPTMLPSEYYFDPVTLLFKIV